MVATAVEQGTDNSGLDDVEQDCMDVIHDQARA
jgi:hypothetical protein